MRKSKSREVKTWVSKVRPELRSVWLQVVTATQSWPSLSSARNFFFFFTFLSLFFFFFNLLLFYLLYVVLLNTHLFGTSPYFIKSFFLGKKLNGCWDIWTSFPVLLLLIILIDTWYWGAVKRPLLSLSYSRIYLSSPGFQGSQVLGSSLPLRHPAPPSHWTTDRLCCLSLGVGAQRSLPGMLVHPSVLPLG